MAFTKEEKVDVHLDEHVLGYLEELRMNVNSSVYTHTFQTKMFADFLNEAELYFAVSRVSHGVTQGVNLSMSYFLFTQMC